MIEYGYEMEDHSDKVISIIYGPAQHGTLAFTWRRAAIL